MAWTFPEIIAAAEARLRVLGTQMERLSRASTAMTTALWPDSVHPCSFSRLARWLKVGPDRLGEWRVSAARAGAEMALRFALSGHPDLQLDALMGQRDGSVSQLQAEADLEKAFGERDRVLERERRGTLLEAQHLEDSFSSKCCFL